jgi:Tfp pilus assembly pilus retraction ATPase PilT
MDIPVLGVADLQRIVAEIADEAHKKMLQNVFDTDYAMDVEGLDRFRVSIFMQRGVPSIVMRRIKKAVPDFGALNLPKDVLEHLSQERRGLILLTGPAGHGKSTTIASMIEYMNTTQARHILTVEDLSNSRLRIKRASSTRESWAGVSSYPSPCGR